MFARIGQKPKKISEHFFRIFSTDFLAPTMKKGEREDSEGAKGSGVKKNANGHDAHKLDGRKARRRILKRASQKKIFRKINVFAGVVIFNGKLGKGVQKN